jgi:hypothetical protein
MPTAINTNKKAKKIKVKILGVPQSNKKSVFKKEGVSEKLDNIFTRYQR